MADPRLIFHVGHPKTGSSALQSSFALSISALRERGLHYPTPRDGGSAARGRISSGNVNAPRVAERYVAERRRVPSGGAMLMSNEAGFRVFPGAPAPLQELLARGVHIEMVMFIRDPGGLARSAYGQMVQRHGSRLSFDRFLAEFGFLTSVERFLDLCDALRLALTVRNYSQSQDGVLRDMETMLSVPAGTLVPPTLARINRSLSQAEIAALQQLTATHGPDVARAVGDAWVDGLPEYRGDAPWVDPETYGAFLNRIGPQVARLNARLPDAVQYRLEPHEALFGPAPAPIALTDRHATLRETVLAHGSTRSGPGLRERMARLIVDRSPGLARALRHIRDRLPR